ncbi:MAG: D-alanine--D-alanine ligase [Wolbachia endosymbiont of Menacanthus eurysternus]|nr:MAG: D-alanine--D-alanine ligase [Wolbachia endosymbiont of Menacanthus eurysternus]
MFPTVVVLSGGLSREREISIMSGEAVKKALYRLSYNVIKIDVDNNVVEKLKKVNPDLIFIALHGPYGEDGCIQGLLEILGMRYTHSGVMASAIAMNKVMSKHIFQYLDIDTPKWYVTNKEDILKNTINIGYPYILKPINEGSSIGIHAIFSYEDYLKFKKVFGAISTHNHGEKYIPISQTIKSYLEDLMIVEEYIPGIELQTAVLLNEAIGTIEIKSKNKFYNYEAKYTSELAEYVFPTSIPDTIYNATLECAFKVHKFLGCKTVSRSDFRYNCNNNSLKMLEINTHPGLTELSVFPRIAKLIKGINFDELIKTIVDDGLQ